VQCKGTDSERNTWKMEEDEDGNAPASCRKPPKLTRSLSQRYGIPNLRDLHEAGHMLKEGKLFRASQVFDGGKLKRLGIQTIIDLRTPDMACRSMYRKAKSYLRLPLRVVPETAIAPERRAAPHSCSECARRLQTNVVHANLITGYIGLSIFWKMPRSTKASLVRSFFAREGPSALMARDVANKEKFGFYALYVMILENSRRGIAKCMRVFLFEENFPVLVHCVHGKDRTGIIIALLLLLCGVDRKTVEEDYVVSEEQLLLSKEAKELNMAEHLQQDVVMAAPLEVISDTIDYIDRVYGGANEYLKTAGLTHLELSTIRINLRKKIDGRDFLERMQGHLMNEGLPVSASLNWDAVDSPHKMMES